jgi:hypothetical protein
MLTAIVSSVVATGLWIKGVEMFTGSSGNVMPGGTRKLTFSAVTHLDARKQHSCYGDTPHRRGICVTCHTLSALVVCAIHTTVPHLLSRNDHPSLGGAFHRASETFSRVDRRLNSAHRNHTTAMKRLHALRAQRNADLLGDTPPGDTPPGDAPVLDPITDPEPHDPCPSATATQPELKTEQILPDIVPTSTAPKALNPELVSFRTFPDPPQSLTIAASPAPLPPLGPINLTPDPASSDII